MAALFSNGLTSIWRGLATFALNLVGVLGLALVAALLWEVVTQRVIAIAPISVPQVLATNGYTSDVAAQRLQSALNEVVNEAHSLRRGPDISMHADLPSIVVPSTEVSIEALAAYLRTFFRISRRWNVSGGITVVQKKLWLRLRLNGRDFYTGAVGGDPERPDDLFSEAAQRVFEETDPYVLAVSLQDSNPSKSLEIAKRIIADRPETASSVPWAHTLVGNLLRVGPES